MLINNDKYCQYIEDLRILARSRQIWWKSLSKLTKMYVQATRRPTKSRSILRLILAACATWKLAAAKCRFVLRPGDKSSMSVWILAESLSV